MGTDKALIEIDGVPMALRAAAALKSVGVADVIAVGGDAGALEALGLRTIPDRYPGQGPLGGVITALAALDGLAPDAADSAVVTLPCDVAEPCADSVTEALCRLRRAAAADVAVPVSGGRPQWLHAVWRGASRPALEAVFDAGTRAPAEAVGALSSVMFETRDADWFRDADTPSDLPLTSRSRLRPSEPAAPPGPSTA